ncbi:MAG: hypothetical protein GY711_08460 [bacterium]|nr:hypothetical protein [bacterium]
MTGNRVGRLIRLSWLGIAFVIAALLGPGARAQWTVDGLSLPRVEFAAVGVGHTALFAGGREHGGGPPYSDRVDLFDGLSETWSTSSLTSPVVDLAATAVGTKALFAGGSLGFSLSAVVDIYDASSGTWTTASLSVPRSLLAATTVGDLALFAGGWDGSSLNTVDIYDDATGSWSTATLSEARQRLAATSAGSYALFGGGVGGPIPTSRVDVFDASTGTWSTASLSVGRESLVAASLDGRAYFAGGRDGSQPYATVDVFDAQTATWSVTAMPDAHTSFAAATIGGRIFFASGEGPDIAAVTTVDVFDGQLWTTMDLTVPRIGLASAVIDDRALFAGGWDDTTGTPSAVVDVFTPMVATGYCTSTVNSSGLPARLTTRTEEAGTTLRLLADDLPGNQMAFFLVGMGQAQLMPLSSQGIVCLAGGDIGRFDDPGQAGTSSPSGHFELVVDLGSLPTNPPQPVLVGQTWNFQAWFRDMNPGPTSNFTDASAVAFY